MGSAYGADQLVRAMYPPTLIACHLIEPASNFEVAVPAAAELYFTTDCTWLGNLGCACGCCHNSCPSFSLSCVVTHLKKHSTSRTTGALPARGDSCQSPGFCSS
jgi:hypothetical protein